MSKKTQNGPILVPSTISNPVAKFAHKTNKCIAFEDRTKYKRKEKHKKDSRRNDGYHVL